MSLLIQFLLRLSFGLALGMAITSSKQVTSGYFRNHLYVTLGLTSLATLLSRSVAPEAFWPALLAGVFSYVGSVCWLYEKPIPGKIALLLVAGPAIGAAYLALDAQVFKGIASANTFAGALWQVAPFSSGLLLGMPLAAMLLGHWYLNSRAMELAPLRRLLVALALAVGLQTIVSSLGLWGEMANKADFSTLWIAFITLRWGFGLIGTGILVWMAWQTLNVPNTQSATGILYVAVIGTFVGETMALLLSTESLFPL